MVLPSRRKSSNSAPDLASNDRAATWASVITPVGLDPLNVSHRVTSSHSVSLPAATEHGSCTRISLGPESRRPDSNRGPLHYEGLPGSRKGAVSRLNRPNQRVAHTPKTPRFSNPCDPGATSTARRVWALPTTIVTNEGAGPIHVRCAGRGQVVAKSPQGTASFQTSALANGMVSRVGPLASTH
jgi:hypothetical protein